MYETSEQAAVVGASAKTRSELLERLIDYAVKNPLKLLSSFVLISGGLLLLTYFVHIGFLPDVDLSGATSMLYAVSLFGLLIASYAALFMVIPGWLVGMARDSGAQITDRDVAFAVGVGVVLTLVLMLLFWWTDAPWVAVVTAWAIYMALAMSVLGAIVYAWRANRLSWRLAAGSGYAVISLFPLYFVMRFATYGDLVQKPSWFQFVALLGLVAWLAGCTLAVATTKSDKRWKVALALAPLALFVVFTMTGSFSAIAQIAVQRFSLGEMPYNRVVVDSTTCQQVNEALGQKVCDAGKDNEAATICPVFVRSRIGAQVVLEFAPMAVEVDGKPGRTKVTWQNAPTAPVAASAPSAPESPRFERVVLSKDQVKTWKAFSPSTSASAVAAPASTALASWLNKAQGGADQPKELAKMLAAICPRPGQAEKADAAASQPVIAASGPTVIQIDAKGSATHQTFLQVQVQNAVSQNTAALAGAGAAAGAVSVARAPTWKSPPLKPPHPCLPPGPSAYCETRCCTAPRPMINAMPSPTCPAASSADLAR